MYCYYFSSLEKYTVKDEPLLPEPYAFNQTIGSPVSTTSCPPQSKRDAPQASSSKKLCEHSSSASGSALHLINFPVASSSAAAAVSLSLSVHRYGQIPPTSTLRIQTTDRLPCLFYFLSTSLHSSPQLLQKLRFARIRPKKSVNPYVGNVGINVSEATSYTGSVVLLTRKKRKENHLLLLAAAAAAAHASP